MPKVNKDFVSREDMEAYADANGITLTQENVQRSGVAHSIIGVEVDDDGNVRRQTTATATRTDEANERMTRDELEQLARTNGISDEDIDAASTKSDLVDLINSD